MGLIGPIGRIGPIGKCLEDKKRLGTLYWRVPNQMLLLFSELLQLNHGTSGLDGLL